MLCLGLWVVRNLPRSFQVTFEVIPERSLLPLYTKPQVGRDCPELRAFVLLVVADHQSEAQSLVASEQTSPSTGIMQSFAPRLLEYKWAVYTDESHDLIQAWQELRAE